MSIAAISDSTISYRDYKIQCSKEDRRHRRVIEKLKARLKEFQETCEHPYGKIHFNTDPSGGSDSFSECDVCGKQW